MSTNDIAADSENPEVPEDSIEELVLGDPVVPEPSAEEEDSIFAEAEVIDAVTPTPPTDTNTNVEVASLSVQSPTQQVGLTPVELQPVLKTEEKSSEPVALEEEQEAFENKEEPTLIEETLIDEEALEGEVSANETTVEETPVEVAPQPEISDPAAEEDQNKLDQYFDDLLSQCENEVEETASSLLEEPAIPSAPKMADGKGKVEEIPLHDECIAPGCDDMPLTRAILDPRDPQILNSHVVVQFDEVIGETDVPGRTHEGVFNCSRATFLFCQKYFYMVLATLCAGPSALCLGMQYAWMAFLHIWCCSPRVRLFRICMLMMRKFYSAVVHCMCDPCAEVVVLAVKSVKK